jgi:organic radical activating enzyme
MGEGGAWAGEGGARSGGMSVVTHTGESVPISLRGKPLAAESHGAHELPEEFRARVPSEMEHRFTSTGIKFWRHQDAMESYKAGTGRSIVSTHVSPEGRCNLKCSYCSVSERTLHSTIELERIKLYVERLKSRGLKAVILTGGGEPTLYKDFNPLAEWILEQGLDLALITNGTQFKRVSDTVLKGLSWVRVSMNKFKKWEELITLPVERLGPQTTFGLSLCHSGDNKDPDFVRGVAAFAERHAVSYVRVLPDCMLPQQKLVREHQELVAMLGGVAGGQRFFHQFKVHGSPCQSKCHQSYFRPYLSEAVDPATGKAGLVFPCDSVVLNEQAQRFKPLFGLCPPEGILDYLDGKIAQPFDATRDCTGCVFTRNVDMLDRFMRGEEDRFAEFANAEVRHANFV